MKPLIGITFLSSSITGTSQNYIRAIEEFGGIPLPLYPGISEDAFADIDGLLLTGGGDIHPDNFGEPYHPSLKYVNEDRDALEIPLCQKAIEDDLPVFGICRGIQVMSVAMGGSLYQDIHAEYRQDALIHTQVDDEDSQHEIEVTDSLLNKLIGKPTDEVNSSHHQAVKDIGEGFVVTAYSIEDSVIEAIENPSKRFVLGVQYHPERMTKTLEFREHRRKLFEAFIQAASE
ncbi:MAG: gamma-glutamyl-gamma-aminobutyrate hydrolase family protein [Candidatus Poribacteria bacterium]|nr:gamma-glutamyl-gamma-aminobutyrate hydrolase family protein [Candidatus Poribacteria bacterium]